MKLTKNFQLSEMKPINGFNGRYFASSDGDIYSSVSGVMKKLKPGISRGRGNKIGYYIVVLCDNNYRKTCSVARLVCEAFFGKSILTVNHINCNTLDNRISNLEYVTQSQNNRHAYEVGAKCYTGSKNPNSRLTEDDAIGIRLLIGSGAMKPKQVSVKYNIPLTTVLNVSKRRTWQHV